MFLRLNFAAQLEMEIREGHGPPRLRAPGAVPALYLLSHTYYMLITTILKPRLRGVNLVGHYTSLYFRVLCIAGLSWGIGRSCGREEEKLQEKGGNVLSDDRMGEEWQPNQPRYGSYYILASVCVICC